ncbi:MAG: crossover junction endodeoxyribonuclease RuvC [Archangium sp.]
MRVLGIDPGSRFLGYGVVDVHGARTTHVISGVIRADGKAALSQRLATIFTELKSVIDVYAPESVAVEGVFTHKNARSALVLGHARGVALLLAAQAELEVFEYAPARVKKSVGAGGNDSKESVAKMVERLLSLREPLERADAYDALAVALCHAHQFRVPRVSGRQVVRLSSNQKKNLSAGFFARLKPGVVRAVP